MMKRGKFDSLLSSSETLDTYVLPFSSSSETIAQRSSSETDSPPLSFSFPSTHRTRLSSSIEPTRAQKGPRTLCKELKQCIRNNSAVIEKSFGVAVVAVYVGLSIAFGTVHKLVLVDQRRFDHPFFMQIMVMAVVAMALELGSLAVGRKGALKISTSLPLALLYVGAVVARYWAMKNNTIHGGFQVLLALQPLVVQFMSRQKRAECSGGGRIAWVIAATCVSVALAVWSPAFSMVYFDESLGLVESASKVCNLLASWVLASIAVVLSSLFYVSAARVLDNHSGASLVVFVRHFSSLCFLLMLVVWPMVESPVDVLETADSRRVRVALVVAAMGAVVFVLRMWMLRSSLVGGPVGLCMAEHYRTLICLGIGWWIYGYLYWGLQVFGLVLGGSGLLVWSLCRIIQASNEY